MELTLKVTKQRVRRKVERNFQWYNSYTGEIWRGRGGEMRFRYDPKRKYSVPYLVDAEDWIVENNQKAIDEWVKRKGFSVSQSSPGVSVTVEILESQLDDLAEELYIKKILFDWE